MSEKNMSSQTPKHYMPITYVISCSHVHLFMIVEHATIVFLLFSFATFTDMDYDAKVYPCYYDPHYLVSFTDKRKMNLRMECTILEMLKHIEIQQEIFAQSLVHSEIF